MPKPATLLAVVGGILAFMIFPWKVVICLGVFALAIAAAFLYVRIARQRRMDAQKMLVHHGTDTIKFTDIARMRSSWRSGVSLLITT